MNKLLSKENILFICKGLISAFLLIVLLRLIEIDSLIRVLHQANIYYLIIALLLAVAFVILRAYKWYCLICPLTDSSGFINVYLSFLFGLGVGMLTPGRIGEVSRVVNVGSNDHALLIGMFFFDKLIDIVVVSAMSVVAFYFLFPQMIHPLLVVILLTGIIFLPFLIKRYSNPIRNLIVRIPFGSKLNNAFKALTIVDSKKILNNMSLALMAYVICCIEVYWILSSFTLIQLEDVFKVHPLVMLTNIIPITIGGLGLRESVSIILYQKLGIIKEFGFWAGLLVFIFNTLFHGIIGVMAFSFRRKQKSLF